MKSLKAIHSSTTAANAVRKGVGRKEATQEPTEAHSISVSSLLLQPGTDGEPPKLSASMTYAGETPDLAQRKRAALKALGEIVAEVEKGAVDLGDSHDMKKGAVTQVWELRKPPWGPG